MTKPFIPWVGGKRRLAKDILPLFPKHTCYCEPFAGAGALFFMKEPSKVEVLNDINGELVNLYRVLKYHLVEFVKQFQWSITSRQIFEWEKLTHTDTLTDIQRAARFYYLQKHAYGSKLTSRTFGTAATGKPKFNLLRIEEDLSAAHIRLNQVLIERLDWAKCIQKYDRPETLFYLDPLYWKTEGYGVEFGFDQYEKMAALSRQIEGKMIISINDHKDIRRLFKGLKVKKLTTIYTIGGGNKGKKATELIIKS